MCRSTSRQADPEVRFRIVYHAQVVHNGAPVATYREHMFEIALGPKRAFENGSIGAVTHRVDADHVVQAVRPRRPGHPRSPKPPV